MTKFRNHRCMSSRVSGNPEPRLYWSRDDGGALPSQHTVRDDRLYIPRVTQQDAGVYVCTVDNSVERFEALITLSIQGT